MRGMPGQKDIYKLSTRLKGRNGRARRRGCRGTGVKEMNVGPSTVNDPTCNAVTELFALHGNTETDSCKNLCYYNNKLL